MATTTNYGWTTPDDTALVKDGAAAIRTLGSSIDTTTKALNPSTTLGDIEYRSSTANTNTRLGIGSTGHVLTVSGGVPAWVAPVGGGKVLQVVAAYTTTETSNSTNVYADTTLTANITPSSVSSKVLVFVSQNGLFRSQVNQYQGVDVKLLRTSTDLSNFSKLAGYTEVAQRNTTAASVGYLDSPATTSSTTYKTQFRCAQNEQLVSVQYGSSQSSIILMEIGA
jgi:hypothetical protein